MLIQNANESLALVMVAMAQTAPVLAGGLDLSVGAVMTLVNCIASHLLVGSPVAIVGGTVVSLAAGALAGFINGCVVVYGRLQPIIATLAMGAIYLGIALYLRPTPGGDLDKDLAWALSNDLFELAATYGWFDGGEAAWFQPIAWIPVPLILMIAVVVLVWLPFRRTITGRNVYAVGSSEQAAYMSGLAIDQARLAAFTMAGFLAGFGGLYLAIQTSSGSADVPQAGGLHAQLDRGRGHRRHGSDRRQRRRIRFPGRRAGAPRDLVQLPHLRRAATAPAAVRGLGVARCGLDRRQSGIPRAQPTAADGLRTWSDRLPTIARS